MKIVASIILVVAGTAMGSCGTILGLLGMLGCFSLMVLVASKT
jgi:hypothetical protein